MSKFKIGDLVYRLEDNKIVELEIDDIFIVLPANIIRCIPTNHRVLTRMYESTPEGQQEVVIYNYHHYKENDIYLTIDSLLTGLVSEFDQNKAK